MRSRDVEVRLALLLWHKSDVPDDRIEREVGLAPDVAMPFRVVESHGRRIERWGRWGLETTIVWPVEQGSDAIDNHMQALHSRCKGREDRLVAAREITGGEWGFKVALPAGAKTVELPGVMLPRDFVEFLGRIRSTVVVDWFD